MAWPPAALWPPSSQISVPSPRHNRRGRPSPQPLQPRRPLRMREPALDRAVRQRVAEDEARRGDGSAGIVDLMPAVEARQRQVDQPRRRLEDQPPMLLEGVEVAPEHMQRRAELFGARLDHASASRSCRPTTHGTPA